MLQFTLLQRFEVVEHSNLHHWSIFDAHLFVPLVEIKSKAFIKKIKKVSPFFTCKGANGSKTSQTKQLVFAADKSHEREACDGFHLSTCTSERDLRAILSLTRCGRSRSTSRSARFVAKTAKSPSTLLAKCVAARALATVSVNVADTVESWASLRRFMPTAIDASSGNWRCD